MIIENGKIWVKDLKIDASIGDDLKEALFIREKELMEEKAKEIGKKVKVIGYSNKGYIWDNQ
jgi:hypothetical protein